MSDGEARTLLPRARVNKNLRILEPDRRASRHPPVKGRGRRSRDGAMQRSGIDSSERGRYVPESVASASRGGSAGRTMSVFSWVRRASPGGPLRGLRTYFLRVPITGTLPAVRACE